jgi:exopolysaccharide biosynthesis WecB/TagA/CpsF family protein
MFNLFALAEEKGYRVYALGARQEVLERAMGRLRRTYPRLQLAGYRDGYFSESEVEAVCAAIRDAGAQILFVAMSSPRKEYFLGKHGPGLGVSFVMGVGGAIDIVAGTTRRAPRIVQRLGFEWLFRMLQEPCRLGPRYAVTNSRFAALLLRELRSRRWGADVPACYGRHPPEQRHGGGRAGRGGGKRTAMARVHRTDQVSSPVLRQCCVRLLLALVRSGPGGAWRDLAAHAASTSPRARRRAPREARESTGFTAKAEHIHRFSAHPLRQRTAAAAVH